MLGIGNGISRLGIGNVGVQNKFVAWNRKWRSSSQVPMLGLGSNSSKVRAKFELWNRKWRSSSQVPTLEIGN